MNTNNSVGQCNIMINVKRIVVINVSFVCFIIICICLICFLKLEKHRVNVYLSSIHQSICIL